MNWCAEVGYRNGTTEMMWCTTRQEARDYLKRVEGWDDVMTVAVRRVGSR